MEQLGRWLKRESGVLGVVRAPRVLKNLRWRAEWKLRPETSGEHEDAGAVRGPPPSPFSYPHRRQPLPHPSHVVDCGTGHIFLMFGCLRLQTHADLIEPSGRRPQRVGVCPDPPAGRGVGTGLWEKLGAGGTGGACGLALGLVMVLSSRP